MSEASPALAAWQAFLARHPATASVDLILPDLVGIARGKRLSAGGFAAGLSGSLSFPGSLYGMDATGANVDASGLIWEQGDPDRPCVVDPSTFAPVPLFCDFAMGYFVAFFLPATVPLRGPLRVRALVCVRCPRTGSERRCRKPR